MRIVIAGLLIALSSSATFAADDIVSPDIDEARFGWSGVYLGASGGYGWLKDIDYQFTPPLRDAGRDWVFGGHAGYLHQFSGIVVGGEFEAQRLNITYDLFNFITVENAYTIKARAGYAWDRLLVTGHIGATYATTNINLADWGLAIGAGLDYALTDHITVGAHYTHHSFRRFDGTQIDAQVDVATARLGFKF